MSGPGQQLDERHDTLAARLAEVNTSLSLSIANLGERVAALEAWREQCNCGTVDIDPIEPTPPPPITPGDFTAIARWGTVPEQTIDEAFVVSVAAYHINGISHVEFQYPGRPPVAVTSQTDGEYQFTLNDLPDGKITVGATAYPNVGKPRTLPGLDLFVRTPHREILLPAGEHKLGSIDLPSYGWLTVKPKPGVAKEDCIITGTPRFGSGHIKFSGLTIRMGQWGEITGQKDSTWLWIDDCRVAGNGWENSTRWVANLLARQYYTRSTFSQFSTLFHGGGGSLFARNVQASDIHEDVFRAMGYAANVAVDGVNIRKHPNVHPDLFDFAAGWQQRNVIFQNINVTNAASQGFAGANMEDVALIDCDVQTPGWSVMQVGGDIRHLLIQDTVMNGAARFRDAQCEGVVLRRSKLGWQEPFLPDNYKQPGIEVQP